MKKTKKSFFTFLLAVILLFSMLPAGTFANAADECTIINGEDWSGKSSNEDGSILWDANTATLTLNDATLDSYTLINFADLSKTLTVKVKGSNTINTYGVGIQTNASLSVEAEEGGSLTVNSNVEDNNCFYAGMNFAIRGGTYNLTSGYPAIFITQDIEIDGAEVTASSSNDVAIFSLSGNITVENGASVTVTSTPYSAIYAGAGNVIVTGKGTNAKLNATLCAISGVNGVEIRDGATVTGESASDSAIFSEKGNVTVTGQDTNVDLTASICALNGVGGVKISDGATVIGESTSSSAVFSYSGNVTVTGENTYADLTAYYSVLQGANDVTIENGATVTGVSTANSAIYSQSGNVTITGENTKADLTAYYCVAQGVNDVTIENGATVIGVSTADSAIYTESGQVTITGENTNADLTAYYCAIKCTNNVELNNGATLIGVSENDSAIYSGKGNVTVTGKNTNADITARVCAINSKNDVEISGGAVFNGITNDNSVIYSSSGSITLDEAEATLESKKEKMCGLLMNSDTQTLTIKDSTLKSDTLGTSISSHGNFDIINSVLTLNSQGANSISGLKDVNITGSKTSITAQSAYPFYGGTITIKEASVSSESTRTAFGAVNGLTISDGANVKAKTTEDKTAVVCENGDIVLDGDHTSVEAIAAQTYGFTANNGRIFLNAGHIKATTLEGNNVILARESGKESNTERPETRITIGENFSAGENIVVTTVWKQAEDGTYYADTLLVPKGTQLNSEGLLEGEYVRANDIEIAKKAPDAPTVDNLTDNSVTLTAVPGYEYRMDDGTWQDSNVFTNLEPNSTHSFYQRIAESDLTYASFESGALTVTTKKSTVSAPAKPTVDTVTDKSVTLKAVEGCEYSKDGILWQDSPEFTDLEPNTEYSFYQRTKETDTKYASDKSGALTVTTKKSTVSAPAKPTVDTVTDKSVTLNAVEGCEYSKDGIIWQDSPEFTDLEPNTEYSFYQRTKETDTKYASDKSEVLTVTTKKSTVLTPDKPTVDAVTDNSVTLKAVEGCEYSKDGIIWQDSPEFTDLEPNTEYSFYQRTKETDTKYASDKSGALTVTTKKSTVSAPAKPTVDTVTDKSVTLKAVEGCEYSKDGILWQDSPEFTDLEPNTEYSFYQRTKETDTKYASDKSGALTVTTKKSTVSAPAKPTVDTVTDKSVTLKAVEGCEYSKDGILWQDSPEFTDLEPNTEYSFFQRTKETDTKYASDKSEAIIVQTKPDNTVVTLNGETTATVDGNIEFTVNVSGCNSDVTSVKVDVNYGDNFELVSGDWLKTDYSTKDFNLENNNGVLTYEKPSDVNGDLIKIVLKAKTASVDMQTVSVKVVAVNGSNEIINLTSSQSVKINCSTHSYDSYIKMDDENHTCICSVCGNVETRAHRWDSGQQTKTPNCNETGNMLYTCLDNCGATKNEAIAKNDNHSYGSWIQTKAPTCTENGTETRTCSVCQNKETRDIKATGHSFGSWKTTKEPTYKAKGEQTRSCSKCSYKETRTIPKLALNIGAGTDGKKAEQTIIKSKNDKDPKGSTFNLLQVKNSKTTKNSIKITFKKPGKTKKFVIYGNRCGKPYKKIKITTKKSFTYNKLKKGKYYKFLVVALDKNGKVVATSKTIHVATKGGKVGNTKKVIITNSKSTKTIKKGKSFTLKTKLKAESKKLNVKKHRKVAFESSNKSIATVSSKGKIKAKKKGTCYIYAYAQNGVKAKIKVKVK